MEVVRCCFFRVFAWEKKLAQKKLKVMSSKESDAHRAQFQLEEKPVIGEKVPRVL
jgi:hypothetical protein